MTSLRTIAVTGSAGRIGAGICNLARRRGLQVIAIDMMPDALSIRADIRDLHALIRHFEGVDCVFHCAGLHAPHVGAASDEAFWSINLKGTATVLQAIAAAGVSRMVLTSSTALLGGGSAPKQPARWIDDNVQVAPRTIYHETKLAAEEKVRDATGTRLRASIVRLGRCFDEGPRLTTFYRLSRGITVADAAAAHFSAAACCDLESTPLIACATTPFKRADAPALGNDARSVIAKRIPELLYTYAARGWDIPERIDRVYDSSTAQKSWRWKPKDNVHASIAEPS